MTPLQEKHELKTLSLCEEGTYVVTRYKTAKTKMQVSCSEGHVREVIPSNVSSRGDGTKCKVCTPLVSTNKKTHSQFLLDIAKFGLEPLEEYKGAQVPILMRNTCGHEYYITPTNLLSQAIGSICRECVPANKLRDSVEVSEDVSSRGLIMVGEYTGAREHLLVCNNQCGHVYTVIPNNLFARNDGTTCRVCYPYVSKQELELREMIYSMYKGYTKYNDKKILEAKEIDVLLPELGLGFEINGLYFHKENKFHMYNKTINSKTKNIRLININEDEWINKRDIVKSRIAYMLKYRITNIYARHTTVREISYPREFLEVNHIQGAGSPSSVNYGLFLKDELVAVMTFSKPRFNSNYDYELVRYCSLLDISITGGASKLLKYFRGKFPNSSIISYSDRRWSEGTLYRTLGFTHLRTSPPGYKYWKGTKSLSRYQCQKHKLEELFPQFYDKELTEESIMEKTGYYKVYDSGQDVWVLE